MLWECAVCNYQFEDDWAVCPECGSTKCFELEEDDFSDQMEDLAMSTSINTTIHNPVLDSAVVDRIDNNPVYGVLQFNVKSNYHCLTLFINDPNEVDRLISHLTSVKYKLENYEEGVC